MVKVYALDISGLSDPAEDTSLFMALSERRKERVASCSTVKGRKEMAGAGLLLSYILAQYGCSEEDIVYGWNGKPTLPGAADMEDSVRIVDAEDSDNAMNVTDYVDDQKLVETTDDLKNVDIVDVTDRLPCFNLSHSGDMVIMAVSAYPVGCDMEGTKTEKNGTKEEKRSERNLKIARRFFTEREQKAVEEGGNEAFYRIWTRKESYIKMTGEGMKVPFLSLETCPELSKSLAEEGKSCWNPFPKSLKSISEPAECFLSDQGIAREGELQTCHFKEYVLPEYQITVCGMDNSFADEILFLKWENCFKNKISLEIL